jgi:hypothetical protein
MEDIENVDVREQLNTLKKKYNRGELRGLVAFGFDGRETFMSVGGTLDDESLKQWFRIMQPWVDGGHRG